jgi:hypothetical protein
MADVDPKDRGRRQERYRHLNRGRADQNTPGSPAWHRRRRHGGVKTNSLSLSASRPTPALRRIADKAENVALARDQVTDVSADVPQCRKSLRLAYGGEGAAARRADGCHFNRQVHDERCGINGGINRNIQHRDVPSLTRLNGFGGTYTAGTYVRLGAHHRSTVDDNAQAAFHIARLKASHRSSPTAAATASAKTITTEPVRDSVLLPRNASLAAVGRVAFLPHCAPGLLISDWTFANQGSRSHHPAGDAVGARRFLWAEFGISMIVSLVEPGDAPRRAHCATVVRDANGLGHAEVPLADGGAGASPLAFARAVATTLGALQQPPNTEPNKPMTAVSSPLTTAASAPRTLVHCIAGSNRSVAVAIAVAIALHCEHRPPGTTAASATATVEKLRMSIVDAKNHAAAVRGYGSAWGTFDAGRRKFWMDTLVRWTRAVERHGGDVDAYIAELERSE